jgi:hypothetical protein
MKFSLLALTFCLSCCGANAARHGVANFRHFWTTGAASVAQNGETCATCCCNCCTKQAPAKPRKATTNLQEPGEMCYVLKVYLHIPTDGRCRTTRHTENRINPIFVVSYDIKKCCTTQNSQHICLTV